jgi:hypothetical protein
MDHELNGPKTQHQQSAPQNRDNKGYLKKRYAKYRPSSFHHHRSQHAVSPDDDRPTKATITTMHTDDRKISGKSVADLPLQSQFCYNANTQ